MASLITNLFYKAPASPPSSSASPSRSAPTVSPSPSPSSAPPSPSLLSSSSPLSSPSASQTSLTVPSEPAPTVRTDTDVPTITRDAGSNLHQPDRGGRAESLSKRGSSSNGIHDILSDGLGSSGSSSRPSVVRRPLSATDVGLRAGALKRDSKGSDSAIVLAHCPRHAKNAPANVQMKTFSPGKPEVEPEAKVAILKVEADGDVTMSPTGAAAGGGVKQEPRADSPAIGSPANVDGQTEEPKEEPKGRIQRRIMPARLRQMSSLLAGSMLEEELLDTQQKLVEEQVLLPPSATLILTTDPDLIAKAVRVQDDDPSAIMSIFADPDVARACRDKAVIETPEFRLRDDSELMGKTRGRRSEEDTSDAAYERRHRKPENLEKRQRKMELDRLVKDRHKLKDRIDQLRAADARLLMPILTARDQQRAAVRTDNSGASTSRSRAAAAAAEGSTEVRLEGLRKELLDEAYETLARYDLLLSSDIDNKAKTRRKPATGEDSGPEDSDASTPARYGSGKGKVRKANGGASSGSPAPLTPDHIGQRAGKASSEEPKSSSARSMRIRLKRPNPNLESSPPSEEVSPRRKSIVNLRMSRSGVSQSPSTPAASGQAGVVAEQIHPNIHARTSGGRFASKSSLSGKKNGKASHAKATSPSTSNLTRRASERVKRDASLSPSPVLRLFEGGVPKREVKNHVWGLSGQGAPPDALRLRKRRSASPVEPDFPTLLPTGSAKVGPSLSEIKAGERKPLRVKLILNKKGAAAGAPSLNPSAAKATEHKHQYKGASVQKKGEEQGEENDEKNDEENDDEDDDEGAPEIVMGAALTEEEAKALLEAAMAETLAESQTGAEASSLPSLFSSAASPSSASPSSRFAMGSSATGAPISSTPGSEPTPSATFAPPPPRPVPPSPAEPTRRNSSRVQATSAFGEKLPGILSVRRDFDDSTFAPKLQTKGWRWALASRGYKTFRRGASASSCSSAGSGSGEAGLHPYRMFVGTGGDEEELRLSKVGRRIGDPPYSDDAGLEEGPSRLPPSASPGCQPRSGDQPLSSPRSPCAADGQAGRKHAREKESLWPSDSPSPYKHVKLDDVLRKREKAEDSNDSDEDGTRDGDGDETTDGEASEPAKPDFKARDKGKERQG